MNNPLFFRFFKFGIIALAVYGLFVFSQFLFAPTTPYTKPLIPPTFLSQVVQAETSATPQTLAEEAGIAAYTQAQGVINFDFIRPAFRVVEDETSDYMIGLVAVPDYDETHDAHVYIHKDGWIMAYYPPSKETSFIVDAQHYDGVYIPTKLEKVIDKVATQGQVTVTDYIYYHFSYPNATQMLFVMEETYNATDDFQITIPLEFTFYERSWFLARNTTSLTAQLTLNEVVVGEISKPSLSASGLLTEDQLLPDFAHTLTLNYYYTSLRRFGLNL